MNLLLLGWSPSGAINADLAEETVSQILRELPFLDDRALQSWRAPSGRVVAVCAGHRPAQTAGVKYAHFEADRFAMYSGRPFIWTDEFETNGHSALEPRFYLQSPGAWCDVLDGRCVVARYDDARAALDLYTDPLGACHLYATRDGATRWFSNSAELLRRMTGSRTLDPLVLASLVGCGWSLGGQPVWQAVRRFPRGGLQRFTPEAETTRQLLPASVLGSFFERGFVAEAAAKSLVAVVRALADWPGRPSSVSLTGGRDSRLVFAAALEAGIEFEARIIVGQPDAETPDVQTARILCETENLALTLAQSQDVASLEDAANALRLCSPGTLTIDLAWNALNRPKGSGLPSSEIDEPLALVHSGHGGELARLYYGLGEGTAEAVERRLYRQVTHLWPRPPISKAGQQLIKEYITRWVHEQHGAGVATAHLPDLFYLLERMNNWVGGSHGFDEYMTDLTSSLWTPRLLPYEFGLPASERSRELFHFHVLNELRPELAQLSFAGSNPSWPTFGRTRPARARRARLLATRARRELRRRYENRFRRAMEETRVAGLTEAAALARERVPESSHEIWQVLDRKQCLALLARRQTGLDVRSQRIVWRLATAFLVCVE